jgi:hypothetical protein
VVVSSDAEAELGAFFHNGKEAAWLRTTLQDMDHPQPATPMQTDNLCAAGIANDTLKQRRSKTITMRLCWIRYRVNQHQFVVHWRRGSDDLADYFTKHHSPAHHRLMRSRYLLDIHKPAVRVGSGEGVLIPTESTWTTNGTHNGDQHNNQPTVNIRHSKSQPIAFLAKVTDVITASNILAKKVTPLITCRS